MIFNYEELNTLFCQVEVLMNSRLLQPVSENCLDYIVLIPGHFLVGRLLISIPETDISEIHINCLSRCNLLQRLKQTFWKRWSREYLNTLLQIIKWKTPQPNLNIEDMVLVTET